MKKNALLLLDIIGCTLLLIQSVNFFLMAMVSSFETISLTQGAVFIIGLFFLVIGLSGYFFAYRLQKEVSHAKKELFIVSILAVIGSVFMIFYTHVLYYNILVIIIFGLAIFLIFKSNPGLETPSNTPA